MHNRAPFQRPGRLAKCCANTAHPFSLTTRTRREIWRPSVGTAASPRRTRSGHSRRPAIHGPSASIQTRLSCGGREARVTPRHKKKETILRGFVSQSLGEWGVFENEIGIKVTTVTIRWGWIGVEGKVRAGWCQRARSLPAAAGSERPSWYLGCSGLAHSSNGPTCSTFHAPPAPHSVATSFQRRTRRPPLCRRHVRRVYLHYLIALSLEGTSCHYFPFESVLQIAL